MYIPMLFKGNCVPAWIKFVFYLGSNFGWICSVTWGRGISSMAALPTQSFCATASWESCRKSWMNTSCTGIPTQFVRFTNPGPHLVNQRQCITCLKGENWLQIILYTVVTETFALFLDYNYQSYILWSQPHIPLFFHSICFPSLHPHFHARVTYEYRQTTILY